MDIKTPDDWFAAYDSLIPRMEDWLPDVKATKIVENIKALRSPRPKLQAFWEQFGELKTFEVLAKLRTEKDHESLHRILDGIWSDLPDRMATRSLPGFFTLCDLCSEVWVFHPDGLDGEYPEDCEEGF